MRKMNLGSQIALIGKKVSEEDNKRTNCKFWIPMVPIYWMQCCKSYDVRKRFLFLFLFVCDPSPFQRENIK